MAWKKALAALIEAFDAALPDDPRIERRKMFGCPCAFINDNMFTGIHEDGVIVRVPRDPCRARRIGGNLRAQARPRDARIPAGARRYQGRPGRPRGLDRRRPRLRRRLARQTSQAAQKEGRLRRISAMVRNGEQRGVHWDSMAETVGQWLTPLDVRS